VSGFRQAVRKADFDRLTDGHKDHRTGEACALERQGGRGAVRHDEPEIELGQLTRSLVERRPARRVIAVLDSEVLPLNPAQAPEGLEKNTKIWLDTWGADRCEQANPGVFSKVLCQDAH
jgi:hypothetical protein